MLLDDYRQAVALDSPSSVDPDPDWRSTIGPLLIALGRPSPATATPDEQLRTLRGLLAVADAHTLSDDVVDRAAAIAAAVTAETPPIEVAQASTLRDEFDSQLPGSDHMSLIVGDITQLGVDAIVNAANQYLLGCRLPNHPCIDNAIHTAAGPRLRDDCAALIQLQGHPEPVGTAKITRGHALIAPFVLHTVGPRLVPGSTPTDNERRQLASSYQSCLDLAAEVDAIRTIAICAISTGVFAFPPLDAARIALTTTSAWLDTHPGRFDRVAFNCFSEAHAVPYRQALDSLNG